MLPECLVKTIKYPTKIICWGAIGPNGTSSLAWIDSTCDAPKYIEMLGKAKLPSFIRRHPHARPLFMEDGAPCDKAHMTKNWHASKGIRRLEGWPGQNPDLNPIKNVWSIMKRGILQKDVTMIDEIKTICKKIWKHLTPIYLSSLFASIPCCKELCIPTNDESIKY